MKNTLDVKVIINNNMSVTYHVGFYYEMVVNSEKPNKLDFYEYNIEDSVVYFEDVEGYDAEGFDIFEEDFFAFWENKKNTFHKIFIMNIEKIKKSIKKYMKKNYFFDFDKCLIRMK